MNQTKELRAVWGVAVKKTSVYDYLMQNAEECLLCEPDQSCQAGAPAGSLKGRTKATGVHGP